jgi:lysophospholipase L1-like esterase
MRSKLLLFAASLLVQLALLEAVARVLTAANWSAEKVRSMTEPSAARGRYQSHSDLPYTLAPGYDSTNRHGFRGADFEAEKPAGTYRIVCIGASTTYGPHVGPSGTYSAALQAQLRERGHAVEVINGGVPGWVSSETLRSLEVRVLPLDPDLVIVYQGRNELFPQSYNHFRPDYSHYRNPAYRFEDTNVGHKALFRLSHLAMLLCTWHGDRLGWSSREEHPLYGNLRYENRPQTEELIANLQEPLRNQTYRDNIQSMVNLCRENKVAVVLCTMAFDAPRLATGNLINDAAIHPALQMQVEENNASVREVGRQLGVPVAETAVLAQNPEWMTDDCHCNRQGHQRRAQILLQILESSGLLQSIPRS